MYTGITHVLRLYATETSFSQQLYKLTKSRRETH